MKYLPFLLLFFSFSVFGETAQECAKLVRTDDRLACFDKLFPSKTDKMIESETVQQKQPSTDTSTRNVTDRSAREVTKTTQDELTRSDKSKINVEDERNSLGFSLSKIYE